MVFGFPLEVKEAINLKITRRMLMSYAYES